MMRPSEYSSLQEELYLLLERKLSYPWSFALNFKQDCFSSKDCFSSNVWHQQHKQDCTEQNNWLCVYPAIRSPLSALSGLTLLASVGFLVPFFPYPLISPLKNGAVKVSKTALWVETFTTCNPDELSLRGWALGGKRTDMPTRTHCRTCPPWFAHTYAHTHIVFTQ